MIPGRVAISSRALERTAVAIAAGALRVPPSTVRVTLADEAGLLGVSVTAPLRTTALRSTAPADGIVTRVQAARRDIRAELTELAGREIGRVNVTISRADIREEKRVR
jgi:hypothetical protein